MNQILTTKNLVTGYSNGKGGQTISSGLNLELPEGGITCLLGPNGIGKSTLLRTIAGLQDKLSGEIYLGQKNLTDFSRQELAKKFSLVLTDFLELGNMTVYSLVALGRFPHTGLWGKMRREDEAVIEQAINDVNISHLTEKKFMEISDGEKQKVQIARALAQETNFLILDEPTVYLDLPGRVEILGLLARLTVEKKLTVLMSTHELDLAFKVSDEIWIMQSGGSIIKGAPEDLLLNGIVQKTFETEHFKFDINTGNVMLTRPTCDDVLLLGEGADYFWTKRALERIGFRVKEKTDNGKIVEIKRDVGKKVWFWNSPSERLSFSSIETLIKHLKHT